MNARVEGDRPAYVSDRLAAWRDRTSGVMLVLAIGSVPILLLDFVLSELPAVDRYFVLSVNIVVLSAFLVDYLVSLSLATSQRAFIASEKLSLVIVIASAVALVPTVAWLGAIKLLRLAPVVRAVVVLLRLVSAGGVAAREARRLSRLRRLTRHQLLERTQELSGALGAGQSLSFDIGDACWADAVDACHVIH
jgi:hypothetical protein